jgi:hypothetical protein
MAGMDGDEGFGRSAQRRQLSRRRRLADRDPPAVRQRAKQRTEPVPDRLHLRVTGMDAIGRVDQRGVAAGAPRRQQVQPFVPMMRRRSLLETTPRVAGGCLRLRVGPMPFEMIEQPAQQLQRALRAFVASRQQPERRLGARIGAVQPAGATVDAAPIRGLSAAGLTPLTTGHGVGLIQRNWPRSAMDHSDSSFSIASRHASWTRELPTIWWSPLPYLRCGACGCLVPRLCRHAEPPRWTAPCFLAR